jgi:hypothetical protein
MLSGEWVGGAWCEQDDLAATGFADDANPPAGTGFFYLIRADAAASPAGTYDGADARPIGQEGRDPVVGTTGGFDCPRGN